ncbi:MAG: ABC-type iron(III) uptake system permease component FbpB [Phormidium sp. OSCR]|nr:MAG: ABC-type iron(III) uptake system permease component FbpB [Phormidium sp. OSCR]
MLQTVRKCFPSLNLAGSLWTGVAIAIALAVATPVFFILGSFVHDSREIWEHLIATVLFRYIENTFILMMGVGFLVIIMGVASAWLVAACEFTGRRILEWGLLLPLAAPAYVLAYTYTEFLDFAGPVQTSLRTLTGWGFDDYWFPNIRSLWGAIALLSLTLYPYVYLLSRVAFLEQSICTIEASRVLGANPWQSFFSVGLPLARPAIAAGTALALMETLNDFGTVQYFSVDTFTTGIYRTWFGFGERMAASQLAAVLLIFVFALLWLEQRSRRQAQYYEPSANSQPPARYTLDGSRGLLAAGVCLLPITLGFLIPAAVLLQMAVNHAQDTFGPRFWDFARNSLLLAGLTAFIGVIITLILAYGVRLNPSQLMKTAARISGMGYAVPGSAIAVGILVPVGALDNAIDRWLQATFNVSTGLLFSGTMTVLIFAYLVRYLAVSLGSIQSSLAKISPNLDEASRSLGHSPLATLTQIHIPLLWRGILTAAMILFVDVMKELPATLIIRPFNLDTLAIHVYNLASDERLAEASGPALALMVIGMIPVVVLSWQISRDRPNQL